jgi:hypothetical protein
MHTTVNKQLKQITFQKKGESQKRITTAFSPQAYLHASHAAPPLGLEMQNSRAIYSCDL